MGGKGSSPCLHRSPAGPPHGHRGPELPRNKTERPWCGQTGIVPAHLAQSTASREFRSRVPSSRASHPLGLCPDQSAIPELAGLSGPLGFIHEFLTPRAMGGRNEDQNCNSPSGPTRCVTRNTWRFLISLDSPIQTRGHLKTMTGYLYPRNAVPMPQATETIPHTAHAADADQGSSARSHRSPASPPSLLSGAKGE